MAQLTTDCYFSKKYEVKERILCCYVFYLFKWEIFEQSETDHDDN